MNTTTRQNTSSVVTQLYLGFSIVFLSALLALVYFIRITPQLTHLTEQSQVTTAQMRDTLDLRASLNNLELAINRFEISEDEFYVIEYKAIYTSILDQMDALTINATDNELAMIDKVTSGLAQVDAIFAGIRAASDAGDYDTLDALDTELYAVLPDLFEQVEGVVDEHAAVQAAFEDDLWAFQDNIYIGLGVSLLLIVAASIAAVVIITNRINRPLVVLAEHARALQRGDCDLQAVEKLAARGGQIGDLATDFLEMAHSSSKQRDELAAEAESIREKIR